MSHRRLSRRNQRRFPKATASWSLDSGGFTELSTYGEWRTTLAEYIEALHRYDEIGRLDWAAPQDWMCEPWILDKTGLSVEVHQQRTIESLVELREANTPAHVIPVLQGWTAGDYDRHIELYIDAGFDLWDERIVGLGSVCRRQWTADIEALVRRLHGYGLPLHGFGVKTRGLARYGRYLTSADSLAWSYNARRTHRCRATATAPAAPGSARTACPSPSPGGSGCWRKAPTHWRKRHEDDLSRRPDQRRQ